LRCISSRLPLSLNRAQYELPDRFFLVGLDKEAVVIFIDFRKVFDSIKMFDIVGLWYP